MELIEKYLISSGFGWLLIFRNITLSQEGISFKNPPSYLNINCYHLVTRKLKQNYGRQLLKCECHKFNLTSRLKCCAYAEPRHEKNVSFILMFKI